MKAKTMSIPVVLCFVSVCLSCAAALRAPDPKEVAALTGGRIDRNSPIEIRFTEKQDTTAPFSRDAFRLVPRAGGSLSWKDEYTLVFTPQRALRANTRYRAELRIGTPFGFTFETQMPLLEVSFNPVRIDGDGNVFISGAVKAEEGASLSRVEDVIRASELGEAAWTHEGDTHSFSFGGQGRLDAERTVAVSWNGRSLGSKEKGFATFRIPRSGSFEVMDIRESGPGVLEVSFSSPLKKDQDLRGFVSLSGSSSLRYAIDGNIARIFGGGEIPPGTELSIQDLQDANGTYLAEPVQYRTGENWELPELRFTGSGTVLPSSQGSTMAVETKNLSGLLVEAFQIYGDNMVQFLQVNSLDGKRELDRVGEPVWVKAFDFEWKEGDRNRWVRRGLDLSSLAGSFPDGMFHIRISFRRRHVQYVCSSGHADFSGLTFPPDTFPAFSSAEGEKSYWDGYENRNSSSYDYSRYRNDPCHPAFYEPYYDHDITRGRNVLVSDLGLLAKKGLEGQYLVAASDLRTARPVPGAAVELVNYQGRVLSAAATGPDGTAVLSGPGTAAFIQGKSGSSRAYLKINDSLALAVSHFDVSGDRPSSGVKGLIYGERGVWRPGDPIYLTFLLSDPASSLPETHPVSFELEDPRGRITEQMTYTSSVDGFYPIAVSTSPDSPTGDWTARVRVGGSVFNKNLKIETVMPNRLRMNLDISGSLRAAPTRTSLSAAWLYGAPAPGLKSDISVTFADRETSFPSFTDYNFRDPSRTVSPERVSVFSGNLDAEGRAGFTMNLNPGQAVPGKLWARFLTRVFEPSGVFSSEQTAVEFSPYSRYVGIKLPRGDASRNMLLTDQDHTADLVVLDSDGGPVSGVELDCAIYKLSWRWWWEQGGGEGAEFSRALSRTPIARGTAISSPDGRAVWNFRVNYPDWGRYMVIARDTRGGHSAASIVYIDWPGWAGRAQEGGQGAAAMLILTPEKQSYTSGEKISVSFPSNREASAMVTVEKGGEVLKNEWINCSDTVTRYEFTADPSMTPNIYIHVTLLQRHLQTGNDLPLRLYGVVPVTVDDPSTRLRPRIASVSNWEPESTVSFTVSEESGRPMAYTAVVVDEGLLGLTRFNLPNPRTGFYAREASFLKSWDLYSQIMGAYSGRLETLLAIGGGDDFFDDTVKETERFKPVVRYFGPFELAAGASRTEEFTLPPYVGALRIMVLAASSSGENRLSQAARPALTGSPAVRRAYGTAEKSVTVSTDLMVYGTVPRTLSPGDEAVIPVSVYLYKDGNRQVTLTFNAEGGADLVRGQSATRQLSFDKSGETIVEFRVRAGELGGKAKFSVSAASAGLRTANHQVELDVRSTAVPVSRAAMSLIGGGESWTGNFSLPGRIGTNTAVLELSRLPPLNLEKRLGFLVAYPHGCVEQTTSAVFPQLYLDRVMKLDDAKTGEVRTNVAAGIERLGSFQTPSGAFSYWPGQSEAHEWGTNYAGHFLIEARRAGYAVPQALLDKWAAYQKGRAASWSSRDGSSRDQAYRLYTLALAGQAELGAMNRLREEPNLENASAWRLAAAYWYSGQRDTARSLVRLLSLAVPKYRELSGSFGTELRDKAMILETLTLLGDNARGRTLLGEISAALSSESWLSTQETAYALIAAVPYIAGEAENETITVEYGMGSRLETASFSSPVSQYPLRVPLGTESAFQVRNRSDTPVYARIIAQGLPEEGSEPALSQGLSLQVEYTGSDGRTVDPGALAVGDDMMVRVTARNISAQDINEIALVHFLPASWEIVNTRLTEDGSRERSPYKYQDIRDDRVMSYFDLRRGASITVSFRVNRAYGGTYFRPAIHAYAMYDEALRAVIPGIRSGR
ncbi:MAG: alpha-2-macroglobulin [Spirochaetaceae bacterium]|jgi:uncharacterized protein YfaS (alpha-2-macroglobulin family)|nr:alpha-2-macroglobulin [Spirochaetaceae bacterium]